LFSIINQWDPIEISSLIHFSVYEPNDVLNEEPEVDLERTPLLGYFYTLECNKKKRR